MSQWESQPVTSISPWFQVFLALPLVSCCGFPPWWIKELEGWVEINPHLPSCFWMDHFLTALDIQTNTMPNFSEATMMRQRAWSVGSFGHWFFPERYLSSHYDGSSLWLSMLSAQTSFRHGRREPRQPPLCLWIQPEDSMRSNRMVAKWLCMKEFIT